MRFRFDVQGSHVGRIQIVAVYSGIGWLLCRFERECNSVSSVLRTHEGRQTVLLLALGLEFDFDDLFGYFRACLGFELVDFGSDLRLDGEQVFVWGH